MVEDEARRHEIQLLQHLGGGQHRSRSVPREAAPRGLAALRSGSRLDQARMQMRSQTQFEGPSGRLGHVPCFGPGWRPSKGGQGPERRLSLPKTSLTPTVIGA